MGWQLVDGLAGETKDGSGSLLVQTHPVEELWGNQATNCGVDTFHPPDRYAWVPGLPLKNRQAEVCQKMGNNYLAKSLEIPPTNGNLGRWIATRICNNIHAAGHEDYQYHLHRNRSTAFARKDVASSLQGGMATQGEQLLWTRRAPQA